MTDLLEELTALRPQPDLDWPDSPAGQRVMYLALERGSVPEVRRRPTRRPLGRRFWIAIALIVALLTAGAGIALYVLPDDPTQAGCYSALDPQADTIVPDPAVVARVGAVAACQELWPLLRRGPADTSNPVVCINDANGRGVFPAPPGLSGQEACDRIGQHWER
ncbi:hypothetical protein ACIB24_19645 [Spongisporangium articulatum]|uniref:Uncharacterized protein n=1 Tax=Spongisporangium articulatum TaxID=3362603 RepID=A0ABW8ASB2_9ACTN